MGGRHPTTADTDCANPSGDRHTLTAHLKANPPPPGRSREHWYLYDVEFDGETIIAGARDPDTDLARALLARGIVGKVKLLDAVTGKPRTIIDIEKAARVVAEESRTRGPRFSKWKPGTFVAWLTGKEAEDGDG